MAVTDLTDSLPWWARQGGPQGGTGATPQGGGMASAPAGGAPSGVSSQDWLTYLSQMFGISPAQAGQLMAAQQGAGNPADMPAPGATPMAGGDVSVRPPGAPLLPDPTQPAPSGRLPPVPSIPQPVPFTPPPAPPPAAAPGPNQFQTGGPELAAARARPVPAGPAPIATPNAPYGGPMAAADAATAPRGGAYSHMPFPGQRDPQGYWGPLPSAGPLAAGGPVSPTNVGGVGAAGAVGAPGGAGGVGAASNPRFVQEFRPNMPAEAGGGQAGRGGPPMMSALNLAGLFNRGQPAVNPNIPAANAQNVAAVPGPMARPDLAQRVPLGQTPTPPIMPGDIAARRAAAANPAAAARARMLRPPYYGG